MRAHRLFSEGSDRYRAARPAYPDALFDHLSAISPTNALAWDCACGNGQAAAGLARHYDRVKATDISAAQIRHARKHPRIDYAVSPAEDPGFADNSVDLVCVAQALHWFDLESFWPAVKRVLKPGGVFAAWGYTWPHVSPAIDSFIRGTDYAAHCALLGTSKPIVMGSVQGHRVSFQPTTST